MTSELLDPIIIVGAPRSGTNALRDALCALPMFHTWPCDELNPLWRTDNRGLATDELTANDARRKPVATIRRAFAARQRVAPHSTVVEKTCANSLRLEFVAAVVPEARIVEIVRDGRDAASSAMERWGGHFDAAYALRKLRFVPPADLIAVAATQISNRLSRSAPASATIGQWGPIWTGLAELLDAGAPLEEITAAQWAACVAATSSFVDGSSPTQVLRVRYECFVTEPTKVLAEICEFAERDVAPSALRAASSNIHAHSVGRWKSTTFERSPAALELLRPGLERLGYPSDD